MEYWNKYFLKENEEVLILKLSDAFKLSWCKETAYPSDASKWTTENPSLGQCAVTSLIIQDELGGTIHKNAKFKHYWNELPSGVIVDLTKEQFNTNEEIISEGKVSSEDFLNNERAFEAKTKERYKVLKKRVKKNLKEIKPTIFLLSSNAQAEYIQDIIEAIGLPKGSIHHFRYSVTYLHPILRDVIPLQGEKIPRFLKGAHVIAIYLNQTRRKSRDYLWNAMLPVRLGLLKNCYKTGIGDNATAHFFFELREGVLPRDSFDYEFKRFFGPFYQDKYALLAFTNPDSILVKNSPSRIFEDQCKIFQSAGLTYSDLEKNTSKEYDFPLMILIEGIYRKRLVFSDKKLWPKYDSSTNKSYYALTEARSYYIKYRTLSTEIKKHRQVVMKFPKDFFSTPSEYVQNIRASYYSQCWEIEPAYVEQGARGYFEISTLTLNADSSSTELDCQISITFETKRRKLLRVLDTVIDFLLAIGPAYLAATKIFDQPDQNPWYINQWPTITLIIYGMWFLAKLLRNAIRGK